MALHSQTPVALRPLQKINKQGDYFFLFKHLTQKHSMCEVIKSHVVISFLRVVSIRIAMLIT